ncbi:MAG: hypothetical protein J5988_06740, partial [Eubacterium sp.]|nr:hypothetical protein [Eubacterium sp.]
MAKFCTKCGRPLADGEVCSCTQQQSGQNASGNMNGSGSTNGNMNGFNGYSGANGNASGFNGFNGNVNGFDRQAAEGFFESMKNRMGLGDPEFNSVSVYEDDMNIIPDVVKPNEGEVPIRQYTVAKLRNRFAFIPYAQAIGRMQVTNKRVIFRAPGRSIGGRTSLQHEFLIDEIGGIEARREFVFKFVDLLVALIVGIFGSAVIAGMLAAFNIGSNFFAGFMSLLLGAAGVAPFFLLNKKWLLKGLCLGGSLGAIEVYFARTLIPNGYDAGRLTYPGGRIFFGILLLAVFILWLVDIFIYAIRPNLV